MTLTMAVRVAQNIDAEIWRGKYPRAAGDARGVTQEADIYH